MKWRYALACGIVFFSASSFANEVKTETPLPKQIKSENPAEETLEMDVVTGMKESYKKQFPELPASRNCMPQDVDGWWVQISLLEYLALDASKEFSREGPEYLLFGSYNRFVQKRTHDAINVPAMQQLADENKKQYIVSAKGTLYIYEDYVLKNSLLCFITTEKTDRYNEGIMILAAPLATGRPMVVSLYELMAGRAKKE